MKRPMIMTVLAIATAATVLPVVFATSAIAQTSAQYRPYGDRDRDGVPNRYDNTNNNRGAFGDRDHDGVPNAFDNRNNNGARGDRDRDGVPNNWDRAPNNPYRR